MTDPPSAEADERGLNDRRTFALRAIMLRRNMAFNFDRRAVLQIPLFLSVAAAAGCATMKAVERLPVVFLHSLAGTPNHWTEQERVLSGGRRTVALSWPGHGGMPLPASTPSVEALAQLTLAQLDEQGIERAIVVGHSAGAAVAIALAKLAPNRVAGLLLADPPGDLRTLPKEANKSYLEGLNSPKYSQLVDAQWSDLLKHAREETRQSVLNDMRRTPQSTVVYVMTALMDFDPVSVLESFRSPVTIVTAPGPALEWSNSLHKRLPHLPVTHLTGVSHWLHMDDPGAFNEILTQFVATVEAAAK